MRHCLVQPLLEVLRDGWRGDAQDVLGLKNKTKKRWSKILLFKESLEIYRYLGLQL